MYATRNLESALVAPIYKPLGIQGERESITHYTIHTITLCLEIESVGKKRC